MIEQPVIDSRIPYSLTDLHIHLGGAVAPHIMFSIAKEQGLKLPGKTYWDFVDLITAKKDPRFGLDDYLAIMHQWTEKIQSSPYAIERSIYEVICKEYRSSNVGRIEIRFNPMKRNLAGEKDLDHIIHAAIRGMDRAKLDYGVKACLLFCLAREFSFEHNEILVKKAIKYQDKGVLGIDLAGSESHSIELDRERVEPYIGLFKRAREAGLKTTVHTGETVATKGAGVISTVLNLKPHRIGHGIRAAYDPEAMKVLKDHDITVEICPSSNLYTNAIKDLSELKLILDRFKDNDVPFTINTDGPYLLKTNLAQEACMLMDAQVLSEEDVRLSFLHAQKASFIE